MVEFVSYDGRYPNLCSGTLVVRVDGVEYSDTHCLISGGNVWFDEDWMEHVEYGDWSVSSDVFPVDAISEIEDLVNENVEQGCCGGCI